MTDPMFLNASGLRDLSQRLNSIRAHENVEHEMTIVRASIELDEAARRLDALAAERDRADRAEALLSEAWCKGHEQGFDSGLYAREDNEFETVETRSLLENPYRPEATA